MSYIIAALVLLTLLHFVYESIVAPSLRLELRFELFALRDRLSEIKASDGDGLNDRHFDYLQSFIHTTIAMLFRLDAWTFYRAQRELEANPEFRKRVRERMRILDDCGNPEIREIRTRTLGAGGKALMVNSGGWAFLVVPVGFVVMGLSKLKDTGRAVLSMSEPDFDRLAPVDPALAY